MEREDVDEEASRPPTDDENWNSWDEAYEETPPWDIGRPQEAFVRLAEAGSIEGRTLDVGCGTGTHALYFAERGHSVAGIDVSTRAIERARSKVRDRDLDVTFRVADVLNPDIALDDALGTFDTVVDSGLLHVFEDDERTAYAERLASVLRPGGHAYVLVFSDDAPGDWGPNRLSRDDIERAFDDGWRVVDVRNATFDTRYGDVPANLAIVERR